MQCIVILCMYYASNVYKLIGVTSLRYRRVQCVVMQVKNQVYQLVYCLDWVDNKSINTYFWTVCRAYDSLTY